MQRASRSGRTKKYDAKVEAIDERIAAFKDVVTGLESSATVGGTYVGSIWWRSAPSVDRHTLERNLLKSAWQHVYNGLNLDKIASAKDRKKFEMAFEDPAPFTLDNIRTTFGSYVQDPRFHILKGLAECFSDLDPAFKSHSKVKIGVEGLPKRIIIQNVGGEYSWGSWGHERLRDTLNAVQVFRGEPHLEHAAFSEMLREAKRHGETDTPVGRLQLYKNGNGHLIFDKASLREVNLALAEFYGEVLPDAEPEDGDLFHRPGTEVAKDLQFYWTPRAVTERVLNGLSRRDGMTILEPSCGDGRMMDVIREVWPKVRMTGVEVDPGRAEEARAKGHNVMLSNFLETTPVPEWDLVVMNPPFYGTHWKKHLEHARKFLKIGERRWECGTLACILPATAFYDGHLEAMGVPEHAWTDLPVASFAESGTNPLPRAAPTCRPATS